MAEARMKAYKGIMYNQMDQQDMNRVKGDKQWIGSKG